MYDIDITSRALVSGGCDIMKEHIEMFPRAARCGMFVVRVRRGD